MIDPKVIEAVNHMKSMGMNANDIERICNKAHVIVTVLDMLGIPLEDLDMPLVLKVLIIGIERAHAADTEGIPKC